MNRVFHFFKSQITATIHYLVHHFNRFSSHSTDRNPNLVHQSQSTPDAPSNTTSSNLEVEQINSLFRSSTSASLEDRDQYYQVELALRESEERLRLALQATQMSTWDWHLATDRVIWSEGHECLFGFLPKQFDNRFETVLNAVHPDDREQLQHALQQARQNHDDYSHEFRVVWADGSVHWLEGKGKFFYAPDGEAIRMLGTVRDISHRKQAETALCRAKDELELRVAERTAELFSVNCRLQEELDERQRTQEALRISQARFAGIVSVADDAIISIDTNQCITLFNQGAEKIFGYTAQEVMGQSLSCLLPDRFTQSHNNHVAEFGQSTSKARRMAERREIYGRRKDGSEFPAEASISKLDLGAEKIFTVILRDVTERKQVERMKDEFVSVVSHELRTPLTSIHGSLGMLASGLLKADSEQGKRLLQIAVESTDRLVRLINDILDIERIESGKVKMDRVDCLVTDLIEEAIDVVQPLANKAGVTLSVTTSPLPIWVDSDRLVQTLTNLLSNAVKFSPPGGTIWLSTTLVELESDPFKIQNLKFNIPASSLLFTVRDQGRGIPADKLDSIFERFQQVDSSDSRNHEGTGLGLAICRSIVQQHGGQIWVESELGKGSTFYFTIPVMADLDWEEPGLAPDSSTPLPVEQPAHQPLVLVCDDDPDTCLRLKALLEQRQYRVITVASGEEAIVQANLQPPDVILLDLVLPGINGWETMAVIKEQDATKNIPVIICSMGSSPPHNTHHDFIDWVSKAVNGESLFQVLQQTIAQATNRVRILIVEDDLSLAQILNTLFEQHGMETFHARTGREAIYLSQQVNPDLLILDLVLPNGDGFAVVEWLQQHNHLYRTPLVVYSAKDLDAAERNRLKLGQTEYLTKGRITIQEFEQRVMELLHRVTGSRSMENNDGNKADSSSG